MFRVPICRSQEDDYSITSRTCSHKPACTPGPRKIQSVLRPLQGQPKRSPALSKGGECGRPAACDGGADRRFCDGSGGNREGGAAPHSIAKSERRIATGTAIGGGIRGWELCGCKCRSCGKAATFRASSSIANAESSLDQRDSESSSERRVDAENRSRAGTIGHYRRVGRTSEPVV